MSEEFSFALTVPAEYPYVILSCVVLSIQCLVFSCATIKARSRTFTSQFLSEQCEDEHALAISEVGGSRLPHEIPTGGFPDSGDGRYSARLSYKARHQFN